MHLLLILDGYSYSFIPGVESHSPSLVVRIVELEVASMIAFKNGVTIGASMTESSVGCSRSIVAT